MSNTPATAKHLVSVQLMSSHRNNTELSDMVVPPDRCAPPSGNLERVVHDLEYPLCSQGSQSIIVEQRTQHQERYAAPGANDESHTTDHVGFGQAAPTDEAASPACYGQGSGIVVRCEGARGLRRRKPGPLELCRSCREESVERRWRLAIRKPFDLRLHVGEQSLARRID
jgi:hypothetical protein